jgi:hypothetical protein
MALFFDGLLEQSGLPRGEHGFERLLSEGHFFIVPDARSRNYLILSLVVLFYLRRAYELFLQTFCSFQQIFHFHLVT